MIPPSVTIRSIWAAVVAAAFLLVVIFAAVQTARIEGFKVWPISVKGYKAEIKDLKDWIDTLVKAQKEAGAAQEAVNAKAEETYTEIAEDIDHEADKARGAQLNAAERYIDAHRVRCPAVGGTPGKASGSASSDGPRDGQEAGKAPKLDAPDSVLAGDYVTVLAEDVRICTVNTLQAEAARDWALQLEQMHKD